jgi:hypothetical protein
MAEKSSKAIVLKFAPTRIERGEWGDKFYISTFRFPIKDAQAFERRCISMDQTMSSILNQLVTAFNKAVRKPENVQLVRTKHPTIWGAVAKKKFFKGKGGVPEKAKKPKALPKRVKKVIKEDRKKLKAVKPSIAEKLKAMKSKKPVLKKSADVLAKLRAMDADEAA